MGLDLFEILVPAILLLGMLLVIFWFRRNFIRNIRGEAQSRSPGLGLDHLTGLKERLTEEEYKKVCQAIMKKMQDSEEVSTTRKEISLSDLESEIRAAQAGQVVKEAKPDASGVRLADEQDAEEGPPGCDIQASRDRRRKGQR